MLGIFSLFAALGMVAMMTEASRTAIRPAIIFAVMIGFCAAGLAFAGFRANLKMTLMMVAIEIAFVLWFSKAVPRIPSLSASPQGFIMLRRRIQIESWPAFALIVLGYMLIVMFIRREGWRMFGSITELKLATEVHRALVPSISQQVGNFEIDGATMPSGQMGGDLVDVIEDHSGWIAYLADVSGHGVPAGMIMAMVKSATRMGAANGSGISGLLSNLNRVLASTCAPNTFTTFACIYGDTSSTLEFALAGHLPILHYRRRLNDVQERSVTNLPLGVLAQAQFETAMIDCEPGDVLAVITDGLTEVSDGQGHELGLEPFKVVLRSSAEAPLPQIMALLRDRALKHGKQLDDQSLLLIRRRQ